MPRKPRRKSKNGMYHVMLRGVNRQTIFEEENDRIRFLWTLQRFKEISGFDLYSYSLMDNHIHLLIKEKGESISKAIQRIGTSYVQFYNKKYERCGHLFQDRFRSESVEDIAYFFIVLRYIHQNPLKAGLASNVFTSKWTSIHDYYRPTELIDIDYPLDLFSPERHKAIQLFTDHMQIVQDDACLDDLPIATISDQVIRNLLKRMGIAHSSQLQQMDKNQRNAVILELKELEGVAIRQLSRITGLSRSLISNIK